MTPTNLPEYQDFIDFANLFDNEYIDLKFAKLIDEIAYANLISIAHLTSVKCLQLAVILNCRPKPSYIQCKISINLLENAPIVTKVTSLRLSIVPEMTFIAFKSAINLANLIAQNHFGQIDIECQYYRALH